MLAIAIAGPNVAFATEEAPADTSATFEDTEASAEQPVFDGDTDPAEGPSHAASDERTDEGEPREATSDSGLVTMEVKSEPSGALVAVDDTKVGSTPLTLSVEEGPHVVEVYSWGHTDDGLPFIVMEYLEGRPLSHLMAKVRPLPVPRGSRRSRRCRRWPEG